MTYFLRKPRQSTQRSSSRFIHRLPLEKLEDRCLLTAGVLDSTFGIGGLVVTDLGSTSDRAFDVVIQSDGKVVTAGDTIRSGTGQDFALVRYNSNGALDTSFGANGRVTTDFKGFGDNATAIVLQADGKILAAGNAKTKLKGIIQTDVGLARYNPNGTLDASFGINGKVITTIGSSTDEVRAMALQTDGKIVVAGYTNSFAGVSNFVVARYNSTGSLDTSFGTGGVAVTDFGGVDMADSLAIQADGKIVVAGSKQLVGASVFALARYNPNGSLDSSFGSLGKVTTTIGIDDGARDVAIQADGLIVAAGFYSVPVGTGVRAEIALTRYLDTGALDPAFGLSGVVTLPVTGGLGVGDHWDPSVAIQANGKMVVAGTKAPADYPNTDFLLARVNGDGSLDTTFGTVGVVTTDFGPTFGVSSSGDVPNAVAIQSDGNIVAAGRHFNPSTSGHDIALARYQGDPPLLAAIAPSHSKAEIITTSDAQPLLSDAFARWQSAGVDTSILHDVQVQIVNLGGKTLGMVSGNTIQLDDNASGWGWFIDSTPSDDSEFLGTDNQGAMQSMDLLSVLMHEMGHLLGYDHNDEGVMAETLAAGTRSVELEQVHVAATDFTFGERLDFDNEFTFAKARRRK